MAPSPWAGGRGTDRLWEGSSEDLTWLAQEGRFGLSRKKGRGGPANVSPARRTLRLEEPPGGLISNACSWTSREGGQQGAWESTGCTEPPGALIRQVSYPHPVSTTELLSPGADGSVGWTRGVGEDCPEAREPRVTAERRT